MWIIIKYIIKKYYYSLKEEDLDPTRIEIINHIKTNNPIINNLKSEINLIKNYADYNKLLIEQIENLEYKNNWLKEIIKFINLRKNDFYHKKMLKK